jgi:hypothetical protein
MRQALWIAAFSWLLAASVLAQQIPAGTVLPIMISTSLNSTKSKPGDQVTGKLMQEIVLPSGEKIRAGARVEGQVVEPSIPAAPPTARLAVRFDRLMVDGKAIPINASLRALASMQSVFEAQLPTSNFDEYGTSISDWTTVQVGGAAVYLGDETVRDAMDIVGRAPAYGVVMAKLLPAPKRGCPANPKESEREQSLWVFSPWACGTYGFGDLTIAHHGVTAPLGSIQLTSAKSIDIRAGSGWLLVVVPAPGADKPAASD